MRLFMTTDAVGGVWTYALDLAAGLSERGVQVTLAVLGPAMSAAQRSSASRLRGVDAVDTGLPLDWTAQTPADLTTAAQALVELARRFQPDVIHLNSPALAAGAVFPAPVVGVCHSDLATWWAAVKGGEPPQDFRWRIEMTGRGYRACNALIAPSAAFAQTTAARYGVSPVVVRNGRAPAVATASAARDIPIITAGRLWDEAKGAAVLDAAAALCGRPVLALGATHGPQGQGERFEHLELAGAVAPDAVGRTLARARVFASAALYEPFGLTVLEAAQAGCALVLSDTPTFRELWEGAARFVPPRDPTALATAFDSLLSDEAALTALAAAAQERAKTYGVQRFVDGSALVHEAVLRGACAREAAA